MPKLPKVQGEGQQMSLHRKGRASPDLQILSGDRQRVLYVLQRQGQVAQYGPDRLWNNLLVDGASAFEVQEEGTPPFILKVVRYVPEPS